jgi:oligoendopeptidase F
VRTAFDICHELGHAIAVERYRDQPTRYSASPRPIEEIPSLLHELLLADHLLDQGGALAEIASNRLLSNLGGNIYGAGRSSTFTHALAQRVEDGEEITLDRVCELGESLRTEFLAPVEFGDVGGRTLPVSGIRVPYCYYQYVLGATGALGCDIRTLEPFETAADAFAGYVAEL